MNTTTKSRKLNRMIQDVALLRCVLLLQKKAEEEGYTDIEVTIPVCGGVLPRIHAKNPQGIKVCIGARDKGTVEHVIADAMVYLETVPEH